MPTLNFIIETISKLFVWSLGEFIRFDLIYKLETWSNKYVQWRIKFELSEILRVKPFHSSNLLACYTEMFKLKIPAIIKVLLFSLKYYHFLHHNIFIPLKLSKYAVMPQYYWIRIGSKCILHTLNIINNFQIYFSYFVIILYFLFHFILVKLKRKNLR